MGFFHLFLEQPLNIDCKALAYLDIGNAGSVDAVRRKEKLKSVDRRQLEVQGEALEAAKKTYGIWKSVKLNKHALVYSMQDSPFTRAPTDNNLVLTAYLCAATYVILC
jgi:hypothetical protein